MAWDFWDEVPDTYTKTRIQVQAKLTELQNEQNALSKRIRQLQSQVDLGRKWLEGAKELEVPVELKAHRIFEGELKFTTEYRELNKGWMEALRWVIGVKEYWNDLFPERPKEAEEKGGKTKGGK